MSEQSRVRYRSRHKSDGTVEIQYGDLTCTVAPPPGEPTDEVLQEYRQAAQELNLPNHEGFLLELARQAPVSGWKEDER